MDDAVVVLITTDPNTEKEEYRVAWIEHVGLLTKFNDITNQWDIEPGYVLDNFTECDIYTNGDVALEKADAVLFSLNHEPEFGIIILNKFKDQEFNAL